MRRLSINPRAGELGARQHAVVSLEQFERLGLSARGVQHRSRRGRLYRVYRGVYSLVPPALLTRKGWWMAAVLAAGPGAVLSHRDAAVLHELISSAHAKIEVTVLGVFRGRPPGVKIHRSRTLTPADVTIVDNIPCTTVARTLFDLGDVVDRRRHERAFDQAEVLEVFDLTAVADQLARNPTRAAAAKTRALLEEHYIGSTVTESELEEAFLALCRRARLPRPELQQWLLLPDGGPPIRADFLWREQRVVVEVDSAKFHGTHQAVARDGRKDQRLIVHGFKPLRTRAKQIYLAPAELEATLGYILRA